jgi:transposase
MTELLDRLPCDLRPIFEQAWTENKDARDRLEIEVKLLKEEIRLMRIEKYGPKSEQLSNEQLELLESEPGVSAGEIESEADRTGQEEAEMEKVHRRQHPGRRELPAHLPRIERILNCTAEQCRCGTCGAETKVIGYDISEELDVKPAEYFVRVTKREKRACPRCEEGGVMAAPLPAKIVEKGKLSNAVVVDVILKKYREHSPLYRQGMILDRDCGVEISRATLCNGVMTSGQWLEVIQKELKADLLAGNYIQADETPIGVQTPEKTGSNHRGYLWQYSRPGGPVVFDFQMGRGREGPRRFLGNFSGYLQSDGYSAYDKIGGEGIVFAGCMTHARRGFIEALKINPKESHSTGIVEVIGALYAVEAHAREEGMSAAERLALRQQKSMPLLAELKKKIIAARQQALPQSALGKACDYTLGQWERLIVYAGNGDVEVCNNLCENSMRGPVLGRKNWLHFGSEDAGPRIAAIMSVMETCRRLGINEREYLNDVLPKIPTWPANRIAELTPMAWQAARAAA